MAKTPPKALSVFFAGLLPVIAFTVIEEYYGITAGLIAGLAFGIGEVSYELWKFKKVSTITWIGNGLILVLGGISLISSEGIWFKLQPALLEAGFAVALWGSLFFKKNIFIFMAEKQGQSIPEFIQPKMKGLTFRVGIFFAIHSVLAVWAALYWSTTAWALLKGVGLMVSFILYLVVEMIFLRLYIMKNRNHIAGTSDANANGVVKSPK
ncbi:MAG: inner membrane-spanning protein YciB [Pseudobdellovibrionaceae bacterium]